MPRADIGWANIFMAEAWKVACRVMYSLSARWGAATLVLVLF
jgi:hypothetical protein